MRSPEGLARPALSQSRSPFVSVALTTACKVCDNIDIHATDLREGLAFVRLKKKADRP